MTTCVYLRAHWAPCNHCWAHVAWAMGIWSPFCWVWGQLWLLCLPSASPLLSSWCLAEGNRIFLKNILSLGTALAVPQCPLTNECVMPFAKWTFQTCETLNFEQRHPFSSACPFGMVGEGPCGAWGGPGGDGAQQTVRSVMRYCSGVLLRRSLWRLGHSRALSGLTGTDAVFGGLVASMRWRGRAAWHCAPRGMHGKDNAGASGRARGRAGRRMGFLFSCFLYVFEFSIKLSAF